MRAFRVLLFTALGAAAAFAWTLLQTPPPPAAPAPAPGESRAALREKLKDAATRRRDAERALKDRAQKFWTGGGASLTRDLKDVQTRLDRLSKIYTNLHPTIAALRLEARKIEDRRDLLLEQDPDYQRLAQELRTAQDENERLWRLYDQSKGESSSGETPAVTVPPPAPLSRPDLPRVLFLGGLAGLVLSLTASLPSGGRKGPAGEVEKTELSSGLPVLAVVPRVPKRGIFRAHPLDEARRRLILLHPSGGPLAESYRELLAGLRLPARPGGRPAPAVGFTAAQPSDKKTEAALNFALTAARAGLKTLLIESDLRRPMVHRLLGLTREPGFSDAALGRRDWSASVRGTADLLFARVGLDAVLKSAGIENFKFLPCGSATPPADALASPRLDAILGDMRSRHDLLVVDVPAVLPAADALALAPRLDAVVLTQERGASLDDLRRAKDRLQTSKTPLAGLLLFS